MTVTIHWPLGTHCIKRLPIFALGKFCWIKDKP